MIPGFSQHYPPNSILGGYGAVQTTIPTVIAYNTSMVSQEQLPKDYPDLAGPDWAGKLIAYDPTRSAGGLSYYDALIRKYGPATVGGIGKNTKRYYDSSQGVLQALAAGEGAITVSANRFVVDELKHKGAPVDLVQPPFVWMAAFASAVSAHAPHPAAATLFAYWVYSRDGQAALNKAMEASSPLCTGELPPQTTTGDAKGATERRADILKTIGINK